MHSRLNLSVAKRLWSFIRVTLYMMRKGLHSKRKLLMDMNLMMKKGKLLGKKTFCNLIRHHHQTGRSISANGYGLREYEFSCSSSPAPVLFHAGFKHRKRHHHLYFPCINLQEEEPETSPMSTHLLPAAINLSPEYAFDFQVDQQSSEQIMISTAVSPFSVRVSNFSCIEENDDSESGRSQVDVDAEEFITRFYEQLKAQGRIALLEHQEMEYQEMLARGT